MMFGLFEVTVLVIGLVCAVGSTVVGLLAKSERRQEREASSEDEFSSPAIKKDAAMEFFTALAEEHAPRSMELQSGHIRMTCKVDEATGKLVIVQMGTVKDDALASYGLDLERITQDVLDARSRLAHQDVSGARRLLNEATKLLTAGKPTPDT